MRLAIPDADECALPLAHVLQLHPVQDVDGVVEKFFGVFGEIQADFRR